MGSGTAPTEYARARVKNKTRVRERRLSHLPLGRDDRDERWREQQPILDGRAQHARQQLGVRERVAQLHARLADEKTQRGLTGATVLFGMGTC